MRARCMVCRADLEARPVPRQMMREEATYQCRCVASAATGECMKCGGTGYRVIPEKTFTKRVLMKPAQVVISCRCEGSFNRLNLPDTDSWELRVCVDCLEGRTFAEVIAVALDQALEAGR